MPSLMAMLGLDASRFKATLDASIKQAAEAGKVIESSLGHHVMGGIGAVVGIGAIEEVGRAAIETAERVSILSQRLGIGTDAVQEWDYALKLNGTSLEAQAKTFEKLAQSRQQALQGEQKQIDSFHALGVAIDDLKNKRLEDVALQISKAFEAGDPEQLIADLRTVGGRGAGEMVAAFRDGLADLVAEAKDAGVVMGEEVVNGLRDAGDRAKTVWMEIVTGVAPAVEMLSKLIQGLWRGLQGAAETTVAFFVGLKPGSGGPAKVIAEMNADLEAKWKAQDDAAAKRAQDRKKTFAGGAEEEVDKKAAREAQRAKDKQDREDERALDQEARDWEYTERHAFDEEGKTGRAGRAGRSGMAVNALQAIGAYAQASPEQQQMLTATRAIEGHVRDIKNHQSNGVQF